MLLNNNKPVDAQSVNAVIISLQNELKKLSNKVDSKEVKKEEEVKPIDVNFDKIYPVGTIYTSINDTNPSTYFGGEWVSLGGGRVLQGATEGQTGGQEIAAGLPNIKGTLTRNSIATAIAGTGALSDTTFPYVAGYGATPSTGATTMKMDFNANNGVAAAAKGIYRDDCDTVQPPALVVHFFKRIA